MFLRVRWFLAGAVVAFGGVGFVLTQVKRARVRVTPENLLIAGKQLAASWLDSIADQLAPEQAGQRSR